MIRTAAILAFVGSPTVMSAQALAQQPASGSLQFEVASIKPRSSDDSTPFRISFEPGGRFIAVNVPLTFLFPQLYPVPSGRIEGRPSWLGTHGFDITAKADGDPSREQMLEMLRSLLRDRFKLVVHYETREEDTFALVVADREGRLGPQLRRIDVDCTARAAAAGPARPVAPLPPAGNGAPACRTSHFNGSLTSGGMTIAALANALQSRATRPVVDKTGLTGHFEVTLKYFDGLPESRRINDEVDFFTAVREQLGLRFEPQRSPVRVLVIDRIERPTPD
jgi:uncharacterized protein (TIGR03435 family)